ncbi:MFS transporter [Actinomadura sp. ATCC 31491]|uniref:MFS transporter n=1 Tax=Actinomadura luzonensis TaxID=2805427 RepID=A0ABT0G0R9_9ACTN|nr:MFS transporter [Actinomadura luzonensis]MCK2218202.1 MFS transporter [Actinomadura luzonensis]
MRRKELPPSARRVLAALAALFALVCASLITAPAASAAALADISCPVGSHHDSYDPPLTNPPETAVLAGLALAVTGVLAAVLPRQEAPVTSVRDEVATVLGRRVLVVIATTAVGLAATSTVFTYLAPTLTRITGFGATAVSTLLLVYGAGSLAGGLVAGRLADRSLGATVRGTFAGLAVVLAVFSFAVPWAGPAVAAVLVLGVLTSAATPVLQSLVLRHAGRAPTLAVSVNVCAFNIGIAAGSALGGGLVAADGLRWLGLAGAVLSLAALAIGYAAVPRREALVSSPA